jgi:hypothetical protein
MSLEFEKRTRSEERPSFSLDCDKGMGCEARPMSLEFEKRTRYEE